MITTSARSAMAWLGALMALIGALAAPALTQGAKPGDKADTPTAVVERFIAAVNRGDDAAVLAFFPEDGVVDDWGRRNVGRTAIKTWSDREFVGAKGRMTPRSITADGNMVTVDAEWKSSFYSGSSRFIFVVEGERVREMRIPRH